MTPMHARSLLGRFLVLASLALLLPGCVSLSGSQSRIVDPRTATGGVEGMSVRQILDNYDGDDAARGDRSQREYRDYVVAVYRASIEANFADFSGAMSGERRALGLGADTVITGFTTYASVARASIVNELSAAAAGFVGLRGAIDRNVYFDRTMTALVASMEAERAVIKLRIEEGLSRDEHVYSLHNALRDLQQLEAAGSLDRAIADLTSEATQQRRRADRELASAVRACTAERDAVVPSGQVSNYLRGLMAADGTVPAANVAEVRLVASQAMGLDARGDPVELIDTMLDVLVEGSQGRCARADVEALIARIEQLTGKDI